jgi:hypothetical protein
MKRNFKNSNDTIDDGISSGPYSEKRKDSARV